MARLRRHVLHVTAPPQSALRGMGFFLAWRGVDARGYVDVRQTIDHRPRALFACDPEKLQTNAQLIFQSNNMGGESSEGTLVILEKMEQSAGTCFWQQLDHTLPYPRGSSEE